MNKRLVISLAIVAAALGGYFWGAGGGDKVAGVPERVPETMKVRKAEGAGMNRAAKITQKHECKNTLSLYAGQDLLWEKTTEEFAAMAGSQALKESHKADTEGLNLREFILMAPDVEVVEVTTCEGKIARWPADKLKMERNLTRFYIGVNSRGAFKMIEFYDGTEQTIMRNIIRITLKSGGQRRIDSEPDPAPSDQ